MAVKIAVLRSGEDVIADIQEVVDKDTEKPVSLIFNKPYVVTICESETMTLTEDASAPQRSTDIVFSKWIPVSEDEKIFVPHDWVVTVVNPHKDILSSYVNKFGDKDGSQDSSI